MGKVAGWSMASLFVNFPIRIDEIIEKEMN